MTSPKSIRLGGLTLTGEPCCTDGGCGRVIGRVIVTGFPGGEQASLSAGTWQSLINVAEVVEKARGWRHVRKGMHTNGPQHTLAMRDTAIAMERAIDALDASEDK